MNVRMGLLIEEESVRMGVGDWVELEIEGCFGKVKKGMRNGVVKKGKWMIDLGEWWGDEVMDVENEKVNEVLRKIGREFGL